MAIQGIDVSLAEKTQTGTDPLGNPIYTTQDVTVHNVLVAPVSQEAITESTDLIGGKAVYVLGIPKGDTHEWNDTTVVFFGHTWRTIGMPQTGIEENIPLWWNTKITVERVD